MPWLEFKDYAQGLLAANTRLWRHFQPELTEEATDDARTVL